jgi:hypothetical protein
MPEEKRRPGSDDRATVVEPTLEEPVAQCAQPSDTDSETRAIQHPPPGRRPLFRR